MKFVSLSFLLLFTLKFRFPGKKSIYSIGRYIFNVKHILSAANGALLKFRENKCDGPTITCMSDTEHT